MQDVLAPFDRGAHSFYVNGKRANFFTYESVVSIRAVTDQRASRPSPPSRNDFK